MVAKPSKDDVIVVPLPKHPKTSGFLVITFAKKSTKGFRSIDLTRPSRCELLTLSIAGTVKYRSKEGNSGGQCIDEIRKFWGDNPQVAELCNLWERWHLNYLRAGTRTQMAAIHEMGPCPAGVEWFTWVTKNLEAKGLLVDRGYSFGSEWLFETIPATVVKRIKDLAKTIDQSGISPKRSRGGSAHGPCQVRLS